MHWHCAGTLYSSRRCIMCMKDEIRSDELFAYRYSARAWYTPHNSHVSNVALLKPFFFFPSFLSRFPFSNGRLERVRPYMILAPSVSFPCYIHETNPALNRDWKEIPHLKVIPVTHPCLPLPSAGRERAMMIIIITWRLLWSGPVRLPLLVPEFERVIPKLPARLAAAAGNFCMSRTLSHFTTMFDWLSVQLAILQIPYLLGRDLWSPFSHTPAGLSVKFCCVVLLPVLVLYYVPWGSR